MQKQIITDALDEIFNEKSFKRIKLRERTTDISDISYRNNMLFVCDDTDKVNEVIKNYLTNKGLSVSLLERYGIAQHTIFKMVSVKELNGKDFYVRDYQRGYRWTKTEIEDLLSDIEEINGDKYCMQPLTIRKIDAGQLYSRCLSDSGIELCTETATTTEQAYELIDGQQRLTTISLILQWLKCQKTKYTIFYELLRKIDNYYLEQAVKTIKEWFDSKGKDTLDEITLSFAVTFDELGITGLFVDEAHNYKNVSIATKFDKVLGINAKGSKKCNLMMEKVRYVQKNGGKVVFATGTPITNSVTDAYIMQSFLQGSELALLDLKSFDAWAGMFSELKADFEIDVDTSKYRLAERFSRFHNLPELSSILSGIADFHSTKKSADLPDFNGYKDCIIEKTPEFADYLNNISSRVDLVRLKLVDRTVDNMLKITTDGRKAALDLRLVDNNKPFTMQSKVYRCAENVFDIYEKYKSEKLTQIIFCDVSTPKKNFNVYDELQRLLLSFGVAPDEIAYIHDATTEKKRSELFEKTRKGEVRILLGSTFKLGIGVNVQDKLIAVHHIDVPWRPADMVQREGRIIRPGNTNKEVFIYRYITDGSFDAYSWQLLETKQNFIAALLEGSVEERNGDDIRDAVLSYAEVKALAIGNPLIKERVEVYNSLIRLKQLQLKTAEIRDRLACELNALPVKISEQRVRIENCDKDVLFYKTQKENIYRARKIEEMNFGEKVVKLEYIEKKREFNEKLYGEIIGHIMESAEKHATDYCGFKVIIPPNTSPDKLCVFLENNGRYQVEIGDTDKGVMQRLYNCLEDMENRSVRLKERLGDMLAREKHIRAELAKDVDYAERITETKNKLQEIDKKLGVEND